MSGHSFCFKLAYAGFVKLVASIIRAWWGDGGGGGSWEKLSYQTTEMLVK